MAVIGRHGRAWMDGIILRENRDGPGWEGQPPGTSEDRGATDPGGGQRVLGGRHPAWQQPVGGARGSHWTPNVQGSVVRRHRRFVTFAMWLR